jgi:hypothetical protein
MYLGTYGIHSFIHRCAALFSRLRTRRALAGRRATTGCLRGGLQSVGALLKELAGCTVLRALHVCSIGWLTVDSLQLTLCSTIAGQRARARDSGGPRTTCASALPAA